ncbi:MFS transporter [Sphingomonas sp. AOB5]|uniref:MFS transporter n=1 Tax=Sphingomonas sp. AOB5 TaxID=3034017 RepID=UPI0023F8AAC5|nr:MFS transporter [Sphingomonas sp. AOB5]MDF7776090.1 MFS transporter [Sphingomonas sp. AOB5]
MSEVQARQAGIATGITLLVPITLSTMAIVLLAPILPMLLKQFSHVPYHDYLVPMVLTVPALCVALLSPIAGLLGDRLGRRRLLIAALLIYAMVGVLPVFLTDLTAILISRIGVGITEAMIIVLTTTLIGDYYRGEARNRWLALQTATASLSALLFFNLGGWLGTFGWQAPFWVYSSALAMLGAVLLFTWEPEQLVETAAAESSTPFPWKRMSGILAITIFASVLFYTVQIHASVGLSVLGVTNPAEIGFLTSIASLGVPAGTLIYQKLFAIPVRRLLLAEFSILATGFVVMGFATTPTAFLIGCGINQIGAGLILPTLLVWAMNQLAFDVRGRGTGMWQGAFAFGQFLSPLAVTSIAGQTGTMLSAFAWLGYAAAGAAAITLIRSARTPLPASAG